MLKKTFIFITIISFVLFMSGCSKDLKFTSNELKKDLEKVEIFYYNSHSDSDLIISIEQENYLDEFINEFTKLQLKITFGAPGEFQGYCIKLVFEDFSYYLISNTHMEHYDENGKLVREDRIQLDDVQFGELVDNIIN